MGRGERFTAAARLAAGALALALFAGPAFAIDEQAERQRIAAALDSGYSAAYRQRSAAPIVALYDTKAEIATYISGSVDREAFGRAIDSRLANSGEKSAGIDVLTASFPAADEARVSFVLSVMITGVDGKPAARQDRWFAQLKRTGGTWLIVRQGYREDFGYTPIPHVGH